MAAEVPVRAPAAAARSARSRPAAAAAVVSASSASRLLLGYRPFHAPRFAAGRAAVAGPVAGLRPRSRRPRLSVVAMAGSGEPAL
jgi:elongation factor G